LSHPVGLLIKRKNYASNTKCKRVAFKKILRNENVTVIVSCVCTCYMGLSCPIQINKKNIVSCEQLLTCLYASAFFTRTFCFAHAQVSSARTRYTRRYRRRSFCTSRVFFRPLHSACSTTTTPEVSSVRKPVQPKPLARRCCVVLPQCTWFCAVSAPTKTVRTIEIKLK